MKKAMLIYGGYHSQFNWLVNKYLTFYHKCIVIDCHTFTPSNPDEVDFCIGTNEIHTPKKLMDIVHHSLKDRGYSVGINKPFSGSIVPSQHIGNENVYSIMIEVNKNVYIDENFAKVRQDIQIILKEIEAYEDSFE